jgi:hypothetical protein
LDPIIENKSIQNIIATTNKDKTLKKDTNKELLKVEKYCVKQQYLSSKTNYVICLYITHLF